LAQRCASGNVHLHTDAVQPAGKLSLDFSDLGVAAMTISAHKFHGPVGIGALLVRHDVELQPVLFGGFQQGGLRPGTEPLALVVGMLAALESWQHEAHTRAKRLAMLRDLLESGLKATQPELVVHGAAANRLPNTSNIAFPGVNRQAMVIALDLAGVACSTGSACASGSSEPSPTLLAMGCSPQLVDSSLRFSVGCTTTAVEVVKASQRILAVYNDLQSTSRE
jgi:cysteine desulfurase